MNRQASPIRSLATAAALALALAQSACISVPAYQQQHVSKTGMTFESDALRGADSPLSSQIEPGRSTSGGTQASGCSACR